MVASQKFEKGTQTPFQPSLPHVTPRAGAAKDESTYAHNYIRLCALYTENKHPFRQLASRRCLQFPRKMTRKNQK